MTLPDFADASFLDLLSHSNHRRLKPDGRLGRDDWQVVVPVIVDQVRHRVKRAIFSADLEHRTLQVQFKFCTNALGVTARRKIICSVFLFFSTTYRHESGRLTSPSAPPRRGLMCDYLRLLHLVPDFQGTVHNCTMFWSAMPRTSSSRWRTSFH